MTLDPQSPYNDLPKLPPKYLLDDIDILKKVNRANKAVSQLNGLIRTLDKPDIILGPLKVKEAVESSSIENINTTISDALQAELFSPEILSPEQKETKNYKQALLLGYEKIKKKRLLATNDIVDIQKKLGIIHPGIRNLPGTKIGNQTTKEVFYTPPEGEQIIRDLLQNFDTYYNDIDQDPDYLVKMAILHYQFEAIHPFFDGNGRTGRILMVLYLTLHDVLISPTLFISKYINQNRSTYYRLLKEVTFENNWKEWILFILDAAEMQAQNTNQIILSILVLKKKFQERVLPQFNFIYTQELLIYLFSNAFYTQAALMQATPIKSNRTAFEYMNTLLGAGVLKIAKSKSREKVYYYEDFLKLLE